MNDNKTISNLVKAMHNQRTPVAKYSVDETDEITNMLSSNLTVKADDIEAVYLFAHNNRRYDRGLIKISLDGMLLASQDGIGSKWVKNVIGVAMPHLCAGSV